MNSQEFFKYANELFIEKNGRAPTLEELNNFEVHRQLNNNEDTFKGMSEVVGQRLASIDAKLASLEATCQALSKQGQRVAWQDKQTKSGITLDGTSAVVTKEGSLLGVNMVPTGPQSATVMAIVREDKTQNVTLLDITQVQFLD